jgi:putative ABC transport system permease protein
MQTLLQDLRYGLRILVNQPGFSLIAIITLALAIGANTAIFSIVDAVLFSPLSYPDSERLVKVNRVDFKRPRLGSPTSPLNFLDWRNQNQSFEYLGGYLETTAFNLTGAGEPERITGSLVSDSLFPALGVTPLLGRNFAPEEDRKDGPKVVILSHSFWSRHFGSMPQVLGQTLTLNGQAHTVIAVMPADFNFPSTQAQLWVPFAATYEDGGRGNFFVDVIGRLKPGVTLDQAQAELNNVAAGLERLYPEVNAGSRVALVPLQEHLTSKVRRPLLLLLGAVAFTLLIACANVANLLLARATVRTREIALRCALGASRARIVGQLLSESLLLSVAGAVVGLFIAYWGVKVLVASGADLPRLGEIAIDGRVLGFTALVAVVTGLLFGLAPALQASKPNLEEALKAGSHRASGSSRWRAGMVITQVALSLVLLIGAGLLLRSLARVLAVNPGFTTQNVLTFDVALPWPAYQREEAGRFFQEALHRVAALPGVKSVGATTALPLSRENNARYFTVEGRVGDDPRDYTIASHRLVSSGYFQTLGFTLLKGRFFTEQDSGENVAPVIVNQTFARTYFADQEPLGKRFKMGETANSPFPWMTIVGVVGDVRHTSLEADAKPEFYRPFLRNRDTERKMTFAIRTTPEPEKLVASIRHEIQALDHAQPIANVSTLEQLVERSVAQRRFSLWLLGLFSLMALLLAVIGIYGVMSYAVSQNTREIGIRMALGAQTRDVLRLIVGQGILLTTIGVLVGLGASFALTRLMVSLLFGVSPTDLLTFGTVALLLIIVALLACYLPARRATKVDPLVALRYE